MEGDNDSVSPWQYLDFDLEIHEESAPRRYPVAARSPEGEAHAEMRFPFDEWELKDKLRDVENALLRSGGKRRRIGTPEEQAVQSFGRSLFEALLVGEVGAHYRMSLREARRQSKGLRLKLHVRPPELSALPWEFVYDPQRDYLSLSSSTPLVRYPNVPQPIERLTVTPPLRVLVMVASPRGLPQLDVGHEKRLIEEAIKGVRAQGLVELSWLEGQSWRDLQRAMRRGPWHVFHFIGHGGFDPETEEGAIALADEDGRKHLLGAIPLARLLDDHYPLRLVFLNSCEGAKGSPRDPFSSIAATLVRSGIPAVVAMQYEITDRAAIEFSRDFYEAVAEGLPVDAAVAEARTAISMASDLEWGTPVLYMRSSDGHIFDISSRESPVEVGSETEDREERERLRGRYREHIASIWMDRRLNRSEVRRLVDYAKELGLSKSEASVIEREVMGETKETILERQEQAAEEQAAEERAASKERYREAVAEAWADNHLGDTNAGELGALASELGLSTDIAVAIERDVMGDTKEAILERQEQASKEKERQDRLDELYARALQAHEAQEWQAVVDAFEQIRAEDPDYPDPRGLLETARKALERERKVATLYERAQRHMRAKGWQQAIERFEEVQRLEPNYRETQTLLAQARQQESADHAEKAEARERQRQQTAGRPIEQAERVQPDYSTDTQPPLPMLGRNWWALALKGLVLVMLGLLVFVPGNFLDKLLGYTAGLTAMVYGALMMANGILAIIDAPREIDRRQPLRVETRISVLLGLMALLGGLAAYLYYGIDPSGGYNVGRDVGIIVFILVAIWAICIGIIRVVAAIRLGQGIKITRLMVMSGALLVVFGTLLLYRVVWYPEFHRLLLGIWPLASGITLMTFAFQARDRQRSGSWSSSRATK